MRGWRWSAAWSSETGAMQQSGFMGKPLPLRGGSAAQESPPPPRVCEAMEIAAAVVLASTVVLVVQCSNEVKWCFDGD